MISVCLRSKGGHIRPRWSQSFDLTTWHPTPHKGCAHFHQTAHIPTHIDTNSFKNADIFHRICETRRTTPTTERTWPETGHRFAHNPKFHMAPRVCRADISRPHVHSQRRCAPGWPFCCTPGESPTRRKGRTGTPGNTSVRFRRRFVTPLCPRVPATTIPGRTCRRRGRQLLLQRWPVRHTRPIFAASAPIRSHTQEHR